MKRKIVKLRKCAFLIPFTPYNNLTGDTGEAQPPPERDSKRPRKTQSTSSRNTGPLSGDPDFHRCWIFRRALSENKRNFPH